MLGNQLFGVFQPGTTPIHKVPLGIKGIVILALSLLLVYQRSWLLSAVCFCLILGLGLVAQLPLGSWLGSFRPITPLLLILAVYYLWMHQVAQGAEALLTMLTLIAASRILLVTTPIPQIIDGFVKLCQPLRVLGISPEKIGLAIALMIRSIPVLMNEYSLIQEAHRARGLKPWPHKTLIPLVLAAVAYAHDTGDALAARGLDQS